MIERETATPFVDSLRHRGEREAVGGLAERIIIKKLLNDEARGKACGCPKCLRMADWSHEMLEGLLGREVQKENLKSQLRDWNPEDFEYRPIEKLRSYKQKEACGPSALKIVYEGFDIYLKEEEIIESMGSILSYLPEEDTGNWWEFVQAHPKMESFKVIFKEESDLSDISTCLSLGLPVIVTWKSIADPEDNSHFGVIYGLDRFHINLIDPTIGAFITVKKEDFLDRWQKDDEGYIRPMMVIYPIAPSSSTPGNTPSLSKV